MFSSSSEPAADEFDDAADFVFAHAMEVGQVAGGAAVQKMLDAELADLIAKLAGFVEQGHDQRVIEQLGEALQAPAESAGGDADQAGDFAARRPAMQRHFDQHAIVIAQKLRPAQNGFLARLAGLMAMPGGCLDDRHSPFPLANP